MWWIKFKMWFHFRIWNKIRKRKQSPNLNFIYEHDDE